MPGLLQKHDVLVLPSIWAEPFSRAILEGMISGLVVVAARTGGTPEIIIDGENGLLFEPNDLEDLAKKIAHLMDDPESCDQMSHAARQTILERFTMTKMMDEIESYLQEVAHISTTEENTQLEPVHSLS
jgi:glycosyltransferase involved in cell wall biosynthesis